MRKPPRLSSILRDVVWDHYEKDDEYNEGVMRIMGMRRIEMLKMNARMRMNENG